MDAANAIVEKAIKSLGKGFDLTSDFRLKFCKGTENDDSRLVMLNESELKELKVPNFGTYKELVSVDIQCDKGEQTRFQSDILSFNKMSEFFNQKSSVTGKIPSGLFNAMYGFNSSSWASDAANTKNLGMDAYLLILFNLHINRYPLVLSEQVISDVPPFWDPAAIARFIEKYGTHIIVGLSIGGHDVILLRQDKSSSMGQSELKKQLDDLGDQLFTGTCSFSPFDQQRNKENKSNKAMEAFNFFNPQRIPLDSFSSVKAKDGITVICSKRGGDPAAATSHCEWLLTVPAKPDAIQFSFIPITSLVKNVPGIGFLSHAINLYLRYKPPIADLGYFLDFQAHKMWAPIHNDLPLRHIGQKGVATSTLHYNLMGPKLYVNTTQVTVGKRPVTGIRLYLEGNKGNRLAIHLQHLSSTPIMLQNKIDNIMPWQGSEDVSDERYLEPIQRKNFSHICTTPVKYDPKWTQTQPSMSTAYIVTGAQLHVVKHRGKSVLHLRLLFSKVTDCCIIQSTWAQRPSSEGSQQSGFFSTMTTSMMIKGNPEKEKDQVVVIDSGVFPTGPPMSVQRRKLLKIVDTTQLCRGPQDSPGHWLVTGAKLDLENGKICLRVKFSLLHICSDVDTLYRN